MHCRQSKSFRQTIQQITYWQSCFQIVEESIDLLGFNEPFKFDMTKNGSFWLRNLALHIAGGVAKAGGEGGTFILPRRGFFATASRLVSHESSLVVPTMNACASRKP
jgi:hypothetical protein